MVNGKTWLKLNKYYICLLQEAHCEKRPTTNGNGLENVFSGNSTNRWGVGILLKPNLSVESTNHNTIIKGRLQALNITVAEKDFFNDKSVCTKRR